MDDPALTAIAEYHNDVESSLRLYISDSSPHIIARFFGATREELAQQIATLLGSRLEETDMRSTFAVLSTLEAAFRADYDLRCTKRLKDDLSRAFRALSKSRKKHISLDRDILEAWKRNLPEFRQRIGELRTALRFRHWLAHGRYGKTSRLRKYDFNTIYALADAVLKEFPLRRAG
ncbi:MAG TPA: hypothetical protein VEI08_00030 [Candidatus Bathyarchaeia archaeon]|nr:hypothetical protein [Candidatus Bathyarchaeia archaeon]